MEHLVDDRVERAAFETPSDAARGLRAEEVHARVLAGATNTAPPTPGRTLPQILRANLLTRFNAILGGLLVVVAIVGPPQDGLFGVVLVANASIGVVQELRAKRTLERLAILNAPSAHVVRDGALGELALDEIVVDDILELRPGDQVPVDGRLLGPEPIEVDEALVSGEADPVSKNEGDLVLSGTAVTAGTGRIRATRVGTAAYAARLESEARRFSLVRSELQQGTNQILRLITWVMVPVGIALVLTQVLRTDQPRADALRGSVAGVAAMVPEGLVLLTSIAFAAGALRLARNRVLVQELPAVEGLARVDALCIDKTGTLTEPGMHLDALHPIAGWSPAEVTEALDAVAEADPAPNATIRALRSAGPSPRWAIRRRVPFSSQRKWSAVEFVDRGTWVLGAPDVLARDTFAPDTFAPDDGRPGSSHASDGSKQLRELVDHHQRAARRVLLLGRATSPLVGTELPATLTPVALAVLGEQLRADAAATVGYLARQGVALWVLSGDAPQTVTRVAHDVGVPRHGDALDASGIGDEAQLAAALESANVLGRVRPDQKVAAVRALKAQGRVVAMVGDGVNDVPALKEADLSIAMGSGSQASRSVARVVLLDSAFAAVPQILSEGRRVIANIERVANLFVTKTVYAALIATVVALSAVPFPFFPRHLTIISTLTIGVPGFLLTFTSRAPRAVGGFTRRVLLFTMPAGTAAAAATLVTYGIARAAPATTATQARSAAMLALFAMAIWILLLVARPLDRLRVILVTAAAAAGVVPFASSGLERVLGLDLPPIPVLVATAVVVAAAIAALTVCQHLVWIRTRATGRRPAAAPVGRRVEAEDEPETGRRRG